MTEPAPLRLGRLAVQVDGLGRVAEHVRAELSQALPVADREPHLRVVFVERLTAGVAPLLRTRALTVGVRGAPESPLMSVEIAADTGFLDRLPGYASYRRVRDWNYLTPAETVAKDVVYTVFDWSTQLRQIGLGQSYIHASAMTKDGRTLVVMGKGGVGKTSSMLKLSITQGWRYLSDDLAVIDDGGRVYRSPKRLQIYAYNTQGEPEIERCLLHGRSLLDRTQWRLRRRVFGPKLVRRRVAADRLLGASGVGTSGTVTDLVFLERSGDTPDSVAQAMTVQDAADRMADIVMDEIEPYSEVSAAACRLGLSPGPLRLPRPAELRGATRDVLLRALAHTRPVLLTVGAHASPSLLQSALERLLSRAPDTRPS